MREDLVLRNVGTEPAGVSLTLAFDADFADVFEVKEDVPAVPTTSWHTRRPTAAD